MHNRCCVTVGDPWINMLSTCLRFLRFIRMDLGWMDGWMDRWIRKYKPFVSSRAFIHSAETYDM